MKKAKYWLVLMAATALCACKTTKKTTTKTEEVESSELIEVATKLVHPPVAMTGGVQLKHLYAGEPNTIQIHTEDGNTAHLQVETTYGQIKPIDLSKGLYSYYSKNSGIVVEILARDTTNNVLLAESYELVPYPAPKAALWTYRRPLPREKNYYLRAEEIREKNAIVLYHEYDVPVRCNARSYQLTRIAADGQRYTHFNETDTGEFDPESQAIILAAEKGDIYLVQEIKTLCSNKSISDIVYVIQ